MSERTVFEYGNGNIMRINKYKCTNIFFKLFIMMRIGCKFKIYSSWLACPIAIHLTHKLQFKCNSQREQTKPIEYSFPMKLNIYLKAICFLFKRGESLKYSTPWRRSSATFPRPRDCQIVPNRLRKRQIF